MTDAQLTPEDIDEFFDAPVHQVREITPRERARPKFDHGLDLSRADERDDPEYWRRQLLYNALRNRDNYYGVSSDWLIIPGFTEADLEGTHWRPWEVSRGGGAGDDTLAMRQVRRFKAILDALDMQHEDRHWFYSHPFCRGCFPDDAWEDRTVSRVAPRLANWMLRHGERGFPADTWDGELPPYPEDNNDVDFMTVEDLAALPEPAWLIEDVLPDSGTGILRARDQSFKSFMALDMALQITFDRYAKVLYCVGEGANQFRHRIDAWLEHWGEEFDETIPGPTLLPAVPNLFAGGDLYDRVLQQASQEKYDLIVIDTYARATAGSDLNSQGDQAIVTARIDELKRATGGTVLLVAHSQKSDLDSSGSIEIEDARDFVFAMKRTGSEVTFEVTKQKDGVESVRPTRYVAKPVGKSMVLVEAGADDGESIMSTRDWIRAALENMRDLGPRSEAQIATWINDHPHRDKPIKRGTLSGDLSRAVKEDVVIKTGQNYSLKGAL